MHHGPWSQPPRRPSSYGVGVTRRSFRVGLRLGVFVGILLVLARVVQARRAREERWTPPGPPPTWPPLQPEPVVVEPPAPTVTERAAPVKKSAKKAPGPRPATTRPRTRKAPAKRAAPRAPQPWVEPTGIECPPTHPAKAKLSSMLYHLPGMAAYNRTRPDRCYVDGAAAEADGFIRAKR